MLWTDDLKAYPIDWLLSSGPSVRYGALRYLLDSAPDAPDVLQAQRDLLQSPRVQALLEGQQKDDHWGKAERYFARYTGTAYRWLMLLHLGVDPQLDAIQRAANFLIEYAHDPIDGGFKSQPETSSIWCYGGWMLWGMFLCGMENHPHVRSAVDWVNATMQFNDGDETVNDPDNYCLGRHTCVRAVVPVLRMLSVMPDSLRSDATERLVRDGVEWVLAHNVYQRSHNPAKPMNAKLTQLTFPDFTFPDFVDILQILLDLGVHDPRMEPAISYLRKKQRKDGTFKVQREHNDRGGGRMSPGVVMLGQKGQPGPWVTLKALRVLKHFALSESPV